jgi:hypothetical protein
MAAEPGEPTLTVPTRYAAIGDSAQRVVIIGVTRRRPRGSVYRTTSLSREAIDEATERLEEVGVVVTTVRTVRATAPLARLEALGLIGN